MVICRISNINGTASRIFFGYVYILLLFSSVLISFTHIHVGIQYTNVQHLPKTCTIQKTPHYNIIIQPPPVIQDTRKCFIKLSTTGRRTPFIACIAETKRAPLLNMKAAVTTFRNIIFTIHMRFYIVVIDKGNVM